MKRKRLLLLLALLITAATGAWAQDAKHRITATLNFSILNEQKTFDVTLPYATTIGAVYTSLKREHPASYLSLTAAEVTSGTNVTIGELNGWDTPVNVTADGNATVGFTATMPGDNINGTITLRVASPYAVKLVDGTADAGNWTATVGTNSNAQPLPADVFRGDAVTLTYGGRLKVKSVTATFEPDPLAMPLTIEAVTPGTIVVNMTAELPTGMLYSVNGGTKIVIKKTTSIEGLKAGDKVQFYGNGTKTQYYGFFPEVSIQGSGDGFQTKVYGNIMSLLDEEGFATKTDLTDIYAFFGLFKGNTTLIDASELLLPAKTLADCCYRQMFEGCTNLTTAPELPAATLTYACYQQMFDNCTSLTKAPKLPATTLAEQCYFSMFSGCTSLTSAYVKAAYIDENNECANMFYRCTATDAVLHTTSDNKASWEGVMGTGKTWSNWSVADDWQD